MKFVTQNSDLLKSVLLTVMLVSAAFWLTSRFTKPGPPDTITISTGNRNGAYYLYALRYKEILKRNNITLHILDSSGSLENIQRLKNKQADLAFVQGGTSTPPVNTPAENMLFSLGSLYYEPIWVFVKKSFTPETLNGFKQRKIAIGKSGSGTHMLAKQLLSLNGIDEINAQLVSLSANETATALANGSIDAGFIVAAAESPIIQQLLQQNTVELFSLKRALAYSRLLPFLSELTLARGIINLADNLPTETKTLLAPTSNLVIRNDMHPGVSVLILQAAQEVHSGASLFTKPGTFPAPENLAYPLSDVAERFYKKGPPFLMRYLPFWAAVLIDRMIVFLLPLIAVMIPLFKLMPPLYRWRVRSRIYRWYEELQETDSKISQDKELSTDQIQQLLTQLKRIDNEVEKVKTPLSYADQLYQLLLHTDLVRKKLISKQASE
ncbi:MAG TPA: TAXI family TRAP transporter solute-binding subunit [Crenotrichaceae bacterium]|nr:TAXI family TRAP transporter solute-binding subunit [Crenotrichaceae bacterium]